MFCFFVLQPHPQPGKQSTLCTHKGALAIVTRRLGSRGPSHRQHLVSTVPFRILVEVRGNRRIAQRGHPSGQPALDRMAEQARAAREGLRGANAVLVRCVGEGGARARVKRIGGESAQLPWGEGEGTVGLGIYTHPQATRQTSPFSNPNPKPSPKLR